MSDFQLTKYKAIIFDVYATLIDWETGLWQGLQPLYKRIHSRLANSKQDGLTAFFSVETDLQAKYPTMLYRDLLARAHSELEARLKNNPSQPEVSTALPSTITTSTRAETGTRTQGTVKAEASGSASGGRVQIDPHEEEHIAFGRAVPSWPAFPDTIPALHYLSTQYKLTVLSNVDKESFSGTRRVLESSLPPYQFKFDAIYTAEDIGSYKPNPANFEYALKKLKEDFGVEKDEVLVVAASLIHDHIPANALGLGSVYIDREGASLNDGAEARYDVKYGTLGAFAEEVRKQAGEL